MRWKCGPTPRRRSACSTRPEERHPAGFGPGVVGGPPLDGDRDDEDRRQHLHPEAVQGHGQVPAHVRSGDDEGQEVGGQGKENQEQRQVGPPGAPPPDGEEAGQRVEEEMTFPGEIKVTVLREVRAEAVAR